MENKKIVVEGVFIPTKTWNGTMDIILVPENDLPFKDGQIVKITIDSK